MTVLRSLPHFSAPRDKSQRGRLRPSRDDAMLGRHIARGQRQAPPPSASVCGWCKAGGHQRSLISASKPPLDHGVRDHLAGPFAVGIAARAGWPSRPSKGKAAHPVGPSPSVDLFRSIRPRLWPDQRVQVHRAIVERHAAHHPHGPANACAMSVIVAVRVIPRVHAPRPAFLLRASAADDSGHRVRHQVGQVPASPSGPIPDHSTGPVNMAGRRACRADRPSSSRRTRPGVFSVQTAASACILSQSQPQARPWMSARGMADIVERETPCRATPWEHRGAALSGSTRRPAFDRGGAGRRPRGRSASSSRDGSHPCTAGTARPRPRPFRPVHDRIRVVLLVGFSTSPSSSWGCRPCCSARSQNRDSFLVHRATPAHYARRLH